METTMPSNDQADVAGHPCPVCGSATTIEADCPGYGIPVMVCYPYCGNAMKFTCTSRTCSWWYRYPNHRIDTMMGIAPLWDHQFMDALNDPPLNDEPEHLEMDTEALPVPSHPCPLYSPFIHYVAYSGRHLIGILIEITHQTETEMFADLWMLSNLPNVAGNKNFSDQFHQEVRYSLEPVIGTWHWMRGSTPV